MHAQSCPCKLTIVPWRLIHLACFNLIALHHALKDDILYLAVTALLRSKWRYYQSIGPCGTLLSASPLASDLPLVANLRCGLWYTTNPSSTPTCYFKSTDGHQNTLNFSTTRLNWHIAELAAKRGGVLIVDATRKGKRFPVSRTCAEPCCGRHWLFTHFLHTSPAVGISLLRALAGHHAIVLPVTGCL